MNYNESVQRNLLDLISEGWSISINPIIGENGCHFSVSRKSDEYYEKTFESLDLLREDDIEDFFANVCSHINREYKETSMWGDLDSVTKELIRAKDKGELMRCDFNGHMLYSDTITMDKAYLKVLGQTKKERDAWEKDYRIKIQKEREDAIAAAQAKIPYWIDRGCSLVKASKRAYWIECVPIRANDLYHGMELDNFIDIATALNRNDYTTAKEHFDNAGHSGMSAGLVFRMLEEFLDDGWMFRTYVENHRD